MQIKQNTQDQFEKHKKYISDKNVTSKKNLASIIMSYLPLIKHSILIISIATQNNWSIYQIYIKSIVLNDFLKEEIYIEYLLVYIKKGYEEKILKLKIMINVLIKVLNWNILFICM